MFSVWKHSICFSICFSLIQIFWIIILYLVNQYLPSLWVWFFSCFWYLSPTSCFCGCFIMLCVRKRERSIKCWKFLYGNSLRKYLHLLVPCLGALNTHNPFKLQFFVCMGVCLRKYPFQYISSCHTIACLLLVLLVDNLYLYVCVSSFLHTFSATSY